MVCFCTGGMKVKADRDESSPYAAMLAAQDVSTRCKVLISFVSFLDCMNPFNVFLLSSLCSQSDFMFVIITFYFKHTWLSSIHIIQELGITALHIKLRATGGNKTKTPGPGAQSALRALARSGMKIGRIGKAFALHWWDILLDYSHLFLCFWTFMSYVLVSFAIFCTHGDYMSCLWVNFSNKLVTACRWKSALLSNCVSLAFSLPLRFRRFVNSELVLYFRGCDPYSHW